MKSTESTIRPFQTCPVSLIPLPNGTSRSIPKIQHQFHSETQSNLLERTKRQRVVKSAFQHSWNGYKAHAWLYDELSPISGGHKSSLGGWAATLVDSLDTLLIMNLDDEFETALDAVHDIDFSTPKLPNVHVFETTIRYLGGLISAYDLTEGKHSILLEKAQELGELLYGAFDTPNRMPQMRWQWLRWVINVFLIPRGISLIVGFDWERINQYLGANLSLQHSPAKALCLLRLGH